MSAGRMPLRGTGLWPSVEPALQSPSRTAARLTIPCARAGWRAGCGAGVRRHRAGRPARQLRPGATARAGGCGAGSPLRGTARGADSGPSFGGRRRSPRGVCCPSGTVASTVPQISSPLRGPCHLFRLRKGVFIKPQASLQSFPFPQPENPALWSHGEELRGTVQQRTSCTGSKQQLNGSESRGPVHRQLKTNPTRMGHH